jgi:tRNA (guanine37-N1)-methyltransferase
MRIDILTLFPEMFVGPFDQSILQRARNAGLLDINVHALRPFGLGRHHVVDDTPYGGGAGMVLRPEPLFEAVESIIAQRDGSGHEPHVVLLTPQGRTLTQAVAHELAEKPWLLLVCGRYEGVDERVREHLVDDEISIGDYVLSGGELPAMVLVDVVARLEPGVLGSEESHQDDSFAQGLLEYPHYTRPADYRGWGIPDILVSGDHAKVARWRRQQSLKRTQERRPDLLRTAPLTDEDHRALADLAPSPAGRAKSSPLPLGEG